jgi:hypothetical protein
MPPRERRLDGGGFAEAPPLIDEAVAALDKERVADQLAHLRTLRERCLNADRPQD